MVRWEDLHIMGIVAFKAYMDAHGIVKSEDEWQRRMRAGQFGHKPARDWLVMQAEADRLIEELSDTP